MIEHRAMRYIECFNPLFFNIILLNLSFIILKALFIDTAYSFLILGHYFLSL